jgi:putative transposase
MTEETLPLAELLAKAGDGDFLRAVAEAVVQMLMEADVEGVIGAGRHERTGERTTYRNGYRDRSLDTRLGSLQLRIPKLRQGSYFPPFLEPRKTSEKALVAVIQEAWVSGVSTRRVDDLVQAMGLSGISKSTVSKLCKDIDERVGAFLDRPLVGEWPYLWLDATYLKQREGGRIVSVAAIIAVAVNTEGKREIVGLHIGPSEAETFWSTFLKSLVRRGLREVKLVISDAHEGLKAAIRRVFGSSWQRCRVGLLKKLLGSDSLAYATARIRLDAGQQAAGSVQVSHGGIAARSHSERSHSRPCRSSPRSLLATCRSAELLRGRWRRAARHRSGGGGPSRAGGLSSRHRSRSQINARGTGQHRDPLVRGLWSV